MNLLQKLILVILTVVVIPVMVIGTLATKISGDALQQQSKQSITAIAKQLKEQLQRFKAE